MRGSWMWRRSVPRPNAPVVKLTTAAQPPAAALEPGKRYPATSTAAGLRGRPVGQGGGEVGQPGRVRLLAVVRPPRRPDTLGLVPHAAQPVRRPVNGLGELVVGDVVGALGGSLLQVRPHQGESPVVDESLRAAVRPERLGLGVGRVQREQESSDHPTHARSDHRQNPPTPPPPRHPRTTPPGVAGGSDSYLLALAVSPTSVDSAATKASWGTSTRPMVFIRFLPSFCFSSSLRLRVMSPP